MGISVFKDRNKRQLVVCIALTSVFTQWHNIKFWYVLNFYIALASLCGRSTKNIELFRFPELQTLLESIANMLL